MASIIVFIILVICVGIAVRYLYMEKKSGHCVGCAQGKCSHSCAHYAEEQEELRKIREIRAAKAAEEKRQG